MAKVNEKAEIKKIKARDKAWGDACDARDAKKVASFYSKKATCVWPDQPAVYGSAAILKAWKTVCADPNLKLKFIAKRFTFAKSGDMATDFGVVKGQFSQGTGVMKVTFKYLVVWIKEKGQWMVLFDTYNYNAPAPSAPGGGGEGDPMQKSS